MTVSLELRAAAVFSPAELAEVFTAGYAGYRFPIALDAEAFTRYAELWDYDLARSRVALVDGSPVGVAMLGVRGGRGWVGGMGVAEAARGTGIGRALLHALLEEARAAGLDEVSLEVLEGNDVALRLYESAGFASTRMLELWVLETQPPSAAAEDVGIDEAHSLIRALRREPEPWQRADETLAHLRAAGEELTALAAGDAGAAIVRPGPGVGIVQLAARDADVARALVGRARAAGESLSFVNVPEGDVASRALSELGGRLAGRQHEMVVRPSS